MADEDARAGDLRQALHALDAALALGGGVLPGVRHAARRMAPRADGGVTCPSAAPSAPARATLAAMLEDGRANEGDLRAIGGRLARFHPASHRRPPATRTAAAGRRGRGDPRHPGRCRGRPDRSASDRCPGPVHVAPPSTVRAAAGGARCRRPRSERAWRPASRAHPARRSTWSSPTRSTPPDPAPRVPPTVAYDLAFVVMGRRAPDEGLARATRALVHRRWR